MQWTLLRMKHTSRGAPALTVLLLPSSPGAAALPFGSAREHTLQDVPVVIPQLHWLALETNPFRVQDLLLREVGRYGSERLWGGETALQSAAGSRHPNA